MATYDKFPEVAVEGYDDCAWQGWDAIVRELTHRAGQYTRTVLVIDCYPGVRLEELETKLLPALGPR